MLLGCVVSLGMFLGTFFWTNEDDDPKDDTPNPFSNWQSDEDSRIRDAVVEEGMPYQEAVQREYGTWDGRSRYE